MKSMKLLPVVLLLSSYLSAQRTELCKSNNLNVFSEINREGLFLFAESADATGKLMDTVFERQPPSGRIKTLLCNDSIVSFIYTNECCHIWYTYQFITDKEAVSKYMDKRRSYDNSMLLTAPVANEDRRKELYAIIGKRNWKMINMRYLGPNDQSKHLTAAPSAPADTTFIVESNSLEDPFTLKQRLRKTSASDTETLERAYKVNFTSLGNKLVFERKVD